jgi:hypothetical protein
MKLFKMVVVAGTLAAAGSADAAGVGVRAGTMGIGADVAWGIAPTLSARLGYSTLSWNRNVSTDGVRYDGKLKLSNFSGLLDFSPIPGPFRITGGLVYNDNKYDMRGEPPGGTYSISGRSYSASDIGSLNGTVKSGRSFAPYLGVGYGNVAGLGVNFYADLGIIFQGSPRASLSASCGASLSAGACAQLQSDVAAERARLEDKLKSFRYYPVLNVGLTIGF